MHLTNERAMDWRGGDDRARKADAIVRTASMVLFRGTNVGEIVRRCSSGDSLRWTLVARRCGLGSGYREQVKSLSLFLMTEMLV